jgi:hypothetical protein
LFFPAHYRKFLRSPGMAGEEKPEKGEIQQKSRLVWRQGGFGY